jgi:hypothetical protein
MTRQDVGCNGGQDQEGHCAQDVQTHLQDVRSTMQDAMLQDAAAVEAGSLASLTGCEC